MHAQCNPAVWLHGFKFHVDPRASPSGSGFQTWRTWWYHVTLTSPLYLQTLGRGPVSGRTQLPLGTCKHLSLWLWSMWTSMNQFELQDRDRQPLDNHLVIISTTETPASRYSNSLSVSLTGLLMVGWVVLESCQCYQEALGILWFPSLLNPCG